MKSINRIRKQIIDLTTGKTYMNESMAEKHLNVSRYYIHKSLEEKCPVGEKDDIMFAYYSYGMNIEDVKDFYLQNNITRSKKWQKLTRLSKDLDKEQIPTLSEN
jgi:hypothetical protein